MIGARGGAGGRHIGRERSWGCFHGGVILLNRRPPGLCSLPKKKKKSDLSMGFSHNSSPHLTAHRTRPFFFFPEFYTNSYREIDGVCFPLSYLLESHG